MGLFCLLFTSSEPIAFILLNVLRKCRLFDEQSVEVERKRDV